MNLDIRKIIHIYIAKLKKKKTI